jgi:tRNA 2-thiouridine synthesizing protein E
MPDVKKFITPGSAGAEQPSDEETTRLAAEEGIALSGEHWTVIRYLRSYYRQHEDDYQLKALVEGLESKFGARGGRRYLYRLFPGGPITQGCRIAGVPVPGGSTDPSFGSRY